MSPQFNAKTITTKARTFADGFTTGQRAVVIVAVLGLLLGAFALSRYLSQPDWAPLYGGLSGEDASAITEQLDSSGVPYQLADNGTAILVPQEQVYSTRIDLAAAGLTGGTDGNGPGWELLDEQGITATEFQQNVAYQRALSGELSKTLKAMSGVEDAVVQLAIPEQSVFSEEEDTPTASVLLKLKPGTELTDGQVQSVTQLVAGSVANLSPDDVTVTDQSGELLSGSGGGVGGSATDAGATDTQRAAFEARMNKAVEDVLNMVVGPNNSKVQVNATLNFDETQTTSKNYNQEDPPPQPLEEATVSEEYSGSGANNGGTLGQQVPTPLASAGGNGTYNREQSTVNNAVNETISKVNQAPGKVERMTAAVVLNSGAPNTITPGQASQLVTNALGLDPARGDTVQVNVLPFDTSAATAAQKALDEAASKERTAGYISLAKQVALALLIIIAAIVFLIRRRRKQQELEEEEARIEATASDLPEGYVMQQQQAIGDTQQLALAREADLSRDRMRDEVSAMVDNQPDDVAAMLQGWLADRK
ncbi:flagellar basal-body MS-ring/collar protein FliF [Kineosporia babensis]|uniref:Flagellar M-ring protein n=1 Tax=Kineosporia babensis TaxID=499548 RepID=A0A9X1N933_9ACTN|nr:flagellar basal-body MS-ring/collar protein FliF [Kineosporia babensis]MCD5309830.1 flagellar M-ring protein FliF [Kineosporia babensis]